MPRELTPACYRKLTNRERSQLQEKKMAKALGGRVQPASGALPYYKGDIKADRYLIEAKTTTKKSYTLTRALLGKIDSEAENIRKTPVLALSFESMPAPIPKDWVLIPFSEFRRLKDVDSSA